MKNDISNQEDLILLIDIFYTKVLENPVLSPFFSGLNFNEHKPRMISFWSFICFDTPGYTTNVTQVHAHMPLNSQLFHEWVNLFHSTVDALFAGEKANLIKERATIMGISMASKHSNQ